MTNKTYTRSVSGAAHMDERLKVGVLNELVSQLILEGAQGGIDIPIQEVHVNVVEDQGNDRWDATATWPASA